MNDSCFPVREVTVGGISVTLRLLEASDVQALSAYFLSLSEKTRSMYGPHPFTKEQAEKICDGLESDTGTVVIALSAEGAIIGYFILAGSPGDDDRERYAKLGIDLDESVRVLAPSVADDYQSVGVGSAMMEYCISGLSCRGVTRLMLMGGVKDVNERGKHFYEKHGFKRVGEFDTGELNYDMIMDIPRPSPS